MADQPHHDHTHSPGSAHLLIDVSSDRRVRTITLNRPEKHNAMTVAMLDELTALFESEPTSGERVTVVRGVGRSFCAGADLARVEDDGRSAGAAEVERMLRAVQYHANPVVARVHGNAIGAGNELALHADLVVADDSARFAMSLAQIGLTPSWNLAKKIMEVGGPVFAREMFLLGDPIPARRMAELGLILRCVPTARLDAETDSIVQRLVANAPMSVRAMKAMLNRQMEFRDDLPHQDVDAMVDHVFASEDGRRGVAERLRGGTAEFHGT